MQQRPTSSSVKLAIIIMAVGAMLTLPIAMRLFGDAVASEGPLDLPILAGRVAFVLVMFVGIVLPVLVFKRFGAQREYPLADTIFKPLPWILSAGVALGAASAAYLAISLPEYSLMGIAAVFFTLSLWICPSLSNASFKRAVTYGALIICFAVLLLFQDLMSLVAVLTSYLLLNHLSQNKDLWWPSGWVDGSN
jgi:hypothetical protein